MRFFKFHWFENRGDKFNEWGFSTHYYETDEELYPIRQVEVYQNGIVLKYDKEHLEDEFGMLGDQSFKNCQADSIVEISQKDFENIWTSNKAFNRE